MTDTKAIQLSEKELSARLNKETLNHPLALSAWVAGLLTATAAGLFMSSEWFWLLVSLSGGMFSTCFGFILYRTYIGKHKAMLTIIEKVRSETSARRERMSTTVHEGLAGFDEKQAIHQLNQLKEKFETFNKVLNFQFDSDELAHKRYLTAAEQLYFGAVDNLRRYMVLRHSVSAIDLNHIHRQLNSAETSETSRSALSARIGIYDKAQKDMEAILSINEQVMTKIDDVTSSLGSIQTREGLGSIGLDSAMQEIQTLISRTDKYDISNL